jgi:predicted porin
MVGGLGLQSRLLVAAGVAVIMGAYPHAPAKAADLEDRIAELEATTVRKGNKKVSVTLYGQVNKSVLWWDDGAEKNTYVVDNNYESSRFGFKGSAKISGDWSAGYRIEIETITAQSNLVNQFNPGDDPSFGALNVRHSYTFIDNKKWGQVRWGLTATPI